MIGREIAHYRVTEKIGAGGMGEVYRAEDTKLGRPVALKVLPEIFASDQDRMARFAREAQVLASLNHPNIAAIYGVEEDEGTRCLVLELVEGETIDQRQAGRPLPVEEALGIGRQIAEALETAHEKGIIHRDLKPANVKITPEGTAKVLDFGLAKALEGETGSGPPSDLSLSPTLTAAATQAGVVLGTASYMSPEQARGRTADKRADIWSFGVVLYEMLSGRRAFTGETVSDILASVLKETPDWQSLPEEAPLPIRELVARCLEKDPRQRLRDMGEARIALERALRGPDATLTGAVAPMGEPTPLPARTSRLPWIGALVVVGLVAAMAAWFLKPAPSEPPVRRLSIQAPDLWSFFGAAPRVSRDGRRVVFIAADHLYVRDLAELEPRQVEDSDGARTPFWSWDGQEVGFTRSGKVWRVGADGGKPTVICDEPRRLSGGMAWGADDRIVLASSRGPLYTVPARGGDPAILLEPVENQEIDFHGPRFLPDGRTLVYGVHRREADTADTLEVLVDGERKVVLTIEEHRLEYVSYAPSGHLIYQRARGNDGIWAAPFSLDSLEVTGEPLLIDPEGSYPSASMDGTLVYRRGEQGPDSQMVWADREGEELEAIGEPQSDLIYPSLSPDGRKVVFSGRDEEGSRDLWVFDMDRGTRMRLTFDRKAVWAPTWSPDGNRVLFSQRGTGGPELRVKPADGTGEVETLGKGYTGSFAADGETLVYTRDGSDTESDLYYRTAGSSEESPFLVTEHGEDDGVLSPDGRYLAYSSDESGRNEIYLKRFPGGEGKWQVSVNGGVHPRWSPDGKELLFVDDSSHLLHVEVTTQPTLELGVPAVLFDAGSAYDVYARKFDLSPDGTRLLLVKDLSSFDQTSSLIVVENWIRAVE